MEISRTQPRNSRRSGKGPYNPSTSSKQIRDQNLPNVNQAKQCPCGFLSGGSGKPAYLIRLILKAGDRVEPVFHHSGVCKKREISNSIQSTWCLRWIPQKCSRLQKKNYGTSAKQLDLLSSAKMSTSCQCSPRTGVSSGDYSWGTKPVPRRLDTKRYNGKRTGENGSPTRVSLAHEQKEVSTRGTLPLINPARKLPSARAANRRAFYAFRESLPRRPHIMNLRERNACVEPTQGPEY